MVDARQTAPRRCLGVLLGTALALAACSGGQEPDEPDPEADSRETSASSPIAAYVDATVPAGSSGTLVAARGGEMVHCDGWGTADHEAGTPTTCDTVYDLQSMTKQFTAAAVLSLQMQGRLDVADRMAGYLDGVPPDKHGITIEHLLTHTAGLIGALGGDYQPLSRADMIARAFASVLRSEPGERYRYSNVGYSLLAAIVEVASGQSYEGYLAEHLLGPAGMTQTGYVLPEWDERDIAVEYDADGDAHGRPPDHPWAADGPFWNLRGNGGLLSTARDMYRWHQALQDGTVLDHASLRALFRPRVREQPAGRTYYGYGWVVAEHPELGRVVWHDGGNGWSYGEIARLVRGDGFVFWVTNQAYSNADDWNLERTDLTLGVLERLDE
jgi:CubicO group peptidase (beta-lactamase class C family)